MSREMKNSGIPWIGEIPKDWKCSSLKYFIDCLDGKRVPLDAGSRIKGEYPYWGAGNIVDYVNDYLFDEELVLLGEDGAPFFDKSRPVAFWVNEKMWANNHIHVLKPLPTVCAKYLVHFLNTVEYKCYINGSILPKLTQGNMNTIPMILPPLAEQQRIAEFLDRKCAEVDEMIALQEQIIEELKAYKQSVITEAVTNGLNPDVPMKDSGIEWIGQIPEHWGVCRVKDCLQNTKNNLRVGPFGSALSGNDICDIGEYWIYNQRTVLDSNFSTNNSFVTKEKYYELESFKVFPNDILITTRGSIGKIAIVPSNAPVGILHPCIIRFVIDKSKYNSRLLKRIFNESDFVLKQLRYQSNSTTIEVIYSYTLRNITLPNIPIAEQQTIADYLDEKCADIDSLIQTKQSKIDSLKEYKKSIIYEYVTGKREVEYGE